MNAPAISDPLKTIEDQHRASHPAHSAWVRAHAGSGKTHVLAQRVIRLLLAGVPPAKILCLTFTKAAAANMSLRIFNTLASWTVLDDARLRKEIEETGAPVPETLERARQLFVRTVETPGGLKVQTIHAFCERLLHLFPFEANVGARFEAIEEETQRALMEEAQLRVLNGEAPDPDLRLERSLALVAGEVGSDRFGDLLRIVVGKREALAAAQLLQDNGLRNELGQRLGLEPGADIASVENDILNSGIADNDLERIIEALAAGSTNDIKLAGKLQAARSITEPGVRADAYVNCFLTQKGTPAKSLGTKKVPQDIRDSLQDEQDRIVVLRTKLQAARMVERTCALYALGDAVHALYSRFKNLRGYLDFDDLINRAATLLSRFDTSWILYKLDAGIDHVLVDEAQDTSPVQWKILTRLTEDFFSGDSARHGRRTIFAVGDEKQSIFSFQGAAPHEFGHNRKAFGDKARSAHLKFEDVELKVSFRSSQTILKTVDDIFAIPEHRSGLTVDDEQPPPHLAWKRRLPGFVEVAPLVAKQDVPDPEDWLLPVDALREDEPAAIMARQVAARISDLLDPANRHAVHESEDALRPARPGDIMILVRKRGPFFDAVIRALKERSVPVAGADRLNIMDHIAIMDLVAAGRAALLPSDDLTLATVLKSPLIGLTDSDLIALAPNRRGALFEVLRESPEESHRAAAGKIAAWRAVARNSTPFDFFSRLLGPERGRRALLSRLGEEANDAVDEFMQLALDMSAPESATLAQFLDRLERTGLEIKRDMEGAGDAVRVMTVHAAKGLEAKIVFLPDTCSAPGGGRAPEIVDLPAGGAESACESDLFVWRRRQEDDPAAILPVLAERKRLEEEEHRRLLYVALTRAEERLYIGGFHGVSGPAAGCWYNMVETSLGEPFGAGSETEGDAGGQPAIRVGEEVRLDVPSPAGPAPVTPASLPAWLERPAPFEQSPLPPLRPSTAMASADQQDDSAAGNAVTAGQREGAGKSGAMLGGAVIGAIVHELLYRLPQTPSSDRADAAMRFLAARAAGLGEASHRRIVQDVLKILDAPELAAVFGSQARAEVTVAGQIAGAGGRDIPVYGRIDRLFVSDTDVVIVDFKTGAARGVDNTPGAYVRQMALYRAVLQPLFPGKAVRALLVWTGGPAVVELPAANLDAAVAAIASGKAG
ncbi:MAG: double-strand break repair helicase AddA [Hyphomicrobiales bacterium]|nr:double-strand break repair helicase AddA [Hyphomicrobiales bacterium]